jgi:hypothetical protein
LFLLDTEGGNRVPELHAWLSNQHHGLRTYKTFQQKTMQLARTDAEHKALYKLLSSIVDPYIDSFDEEPLPVGLAETTFGRLLDVVRDAENSISLAPQDQIKVLNELAAVELI